MVGNTLPGVMRNYQFPHSTADNGTVNAVTRPPNRHRGPVSTRQSDQFCTHPPGTDTERSGKQNGGPWSS
jgi:hypothetical protein